MAAITWYATNNLASVHQEMSETDPGAEAFASPVTGWIVGTGSTNRSQFVAQVERASSTFVDSAPPDGSIDTTNGDCLRSTKRYTGRFLSANWTVTFCARANTNGGTQDGRMYCRLFRSANADGSSATEITSGAQQGGLVTNLSSSTQDSAVSFNPGAFSVNNEYIFVQLAWERTGAGNAVGADVDMRIGNTSGHGTRVLSADFASGPGFRGQKRGRLMSGLPFFSQVLTSQRAVGTLFNTYTTAKTVINQENLVVLPANYLAIGSKFRIRAAGGISNVVTSQPTFTFQVMMGSIVAWTSGAIATNTTAHTLIPFDLDVTLRCDSVGTGTSAKYLGMGKLNGIMWTVGAGADSTTVVGTFPTPATAPAVGTGFDSTIANVLDFWVGISASSGSNGIQLYDYSVEQLWS